MERDGIVLNSFKFILQLQEKDTRHFEGRSWVWYQNSKAVFLFDGQRRGKSISLSELRLLDADALPSGEWCIKNMQLKRYHADGFEWLKGTWQGKTTFSTCTPGNIKLKKVNRV